MIIYGYAKDYLYSGDGSLKVKVRIPSIHGPYKKSDSKGKIIHSYVEDSNLPYYPSILLPHNPKEGEVVVLSSMNEANNEFIVIGITGGSYKQNG